MAKKVKVNKSPVRISSSAFNPIQFGSIPTSSFPTVTFPDARTVTPAGSGGLRAPGFQTFAPRGAALGGGIPFGTPSSPSIPNLSPQIDYTYNPQRFGIDQIKPKVTSGSFAPAGQAPPGMYDNLDPNKPWSTKNYVGKRPWREGTKVRLTPGMGPAQSQQAARQELETFKKGYGPRPTPAQTPQTPQAPRVPTTPTTTTRPGVPNLQSLPSPKTGPVTVAQQMEGLKKQVAAAAQEGKAAPKRIATAGGFGTGLASFVGGGLAGLGYDALVPQEYRDWASRTGFQFGDTTDVNLDNVGKMAAFEAGAAIPSVAINRMTGGALGTPAAAAARGFLPNVLGGLVGSQQGAKTAERAAKAVGLGDTGQAVAGIAGSIPGFFGGRNVATNLMSKAGRQSMLQGGVKGFGTKLGAAGAILDTAFTVADQRNRQYKGVGGELESILDPGDLLALSGGPVGLAAFVGTKGLKVGGAISRAAIDAEQQKKNKLATDLTNAISTLQNTDWSKQPKGAKEQWEKYTRDLEAQRKNMTTIFGDEKKAVELASQEGMRDFNFTYNPQTKGLQFQSDVADERKRRAQDTARASGATPAEFKDIEQRLQVAALKKQAEEAPKTAEGRARIKEVESQEQAAQRFAAQDAVRQAREAGYEPDPELLKQAAGPIEKDPNAKESAQTAIDAEVEGIRAKENEQMQQAQRKEEERKAKNAAAEKKLADARIGDSEAAQSSRNLEAMSKKLREMPSLEQQIQMAKDKLKSR
jgi:hypothetical protein